MVKKHLQRTVTHFRLPVRAAFLLLLLVSITAQARADSTSGGRESALTPAERQLVASVPYSAGPLVNQSGRFATRFSVPDGMNWQRIYKNPHIRTLIIKDLPGSTSTRLYSVTDVEGVFPVEAKYFFAAISDFASYPRVSPPTVYDVGRGSTPTQFGYHKRVEKISARVLIFGDSYLLVTNNYTQRLGRNAYGMKWNLEKSLDGKLSLVRGSWYLRAIDCGGRPCTYVRYYNETGFTKPPVVPSWVLSFFARISFRDLLGNFYYSALSHQETGVSSPPRTNDLLTNH